MTERLPENEAEFRLVDPIAEEYRLLMHVYDQLLIGEYGHQWVNAVDTERVPFSEFVRHKLAGALVTSANAGCFDGGLQGELPVIPEEILDKVVQKWGWKNWEDFLDWYDKEYADEVGDGPPLPDVYKDALT